MRKYIPPNAHDPEDALARIEDLPEPRTDTLAKAPLELVVCQVRHDPRQVLAEPGTALALQERLRPEFTRLEPAAAQAIQIGQFGAQPQLSSAGGWRLQNATGSLTVTISPDSFSLECNRYTRWSDFRGLLGRLLEAVVDVAEPQLIQRVGVRYIDRMWRQESTVPSEWSQFLDQGMLGLALNDRLADAVRVAQTYCELDFEGVRANIRGSIASDQTPNGYSFLLDTDCFDERSGAFEREVLEETISTLHSLNLRLFQTVVRDELYEEMLQ